MMDSDMVTNLEGEQPSPFHAKMLEHCKKLTRMSRERMSAFYRRWDRFNNIYRGIMTPDNDDRRARERGEPEKMVIPIARAQVDTWVSFLYMLYTQRPTFFELTGTGDEDYRKAKIAEALLERDLDYNNFQQKLYQFLLDTARYGIGVFKHGWLHETQEVEDTQTIAGESIDGESEVAAQVTKKERLTMYQGNFIKVVSPYRWLPDTRLPTWRFQEGEFCGSEDEFTRTSLKQRESDGEIVGVDFIPVMSTKMLEDRGSTRFVFTETSQGPIEGRGGVTDSSILITEVQVSIVPKKFIVEGKPLGPEDYPVKYVVEYANDQRIIRCERMDYDHNQYTYCVGEYSPDANNLINAGASETIDQLQETVSWFINSRISNVRKVIANKFVVDPSGIELADLEKRDPVIRLKPSAYRTGVDRWIHQLNVQDVTSNHMKDAMALKDVVQYVTGINENATGQYSSGRRSAAESRAVNSGAAMRLKTPASLINSGALEPMARMLLSNLRQGLDEETYVKVMGESADPRDFQLIKASKQDLVGNYDFVIFDCTLPSERAYQASVLKELMLGMIQNPEAAQIFGYGPDDLKYLLNTILDLQGVKAPPKQLPQVQPQPNAMQQGQPATAPMAGAPRLPVINPAAAAPGPSGVPNLGSVIGGLTGPQQ